MQLRVLNEQFIPLEVIDTYKSLLWTDRYDVCGDFELCMDPNSSVADMIKKDYYLEFSDSEHTMIVEDFDTDTDFDDGDLLIIKGRSLESILDRRIVWTQTVLNGNFQNQMQKLINDAIINPSISSRKIPNFIFKPSTDPRITSLKYEAQHTGDNLYTVITEACNKLKVGFKILLVDGKFIMEFYYGADRSYDQNDNPVVSFSPGFENLRKSVYKENNSPLKTVALVAGEGEGAARKTMAVESSVSKSGLLRRELYVDARDISTTTENNVTISESQYNELLRQRGVRDLNENFYVRSFEGEAEVNSAFILGKDFFLGDLVHIANQYGKEAKSRVIEIIFSHDSDKMTTVPTFSSSELNLTYKESENQTLIPNRPPISESMEEARKAIEKANKDITSIIHDLSKMVVLVDVLYYVSTSNSELLGGEWISNIENIQNGYIWTKTKTVYKDGHFVETKPVCIYSVGTDEESKTIQAIIEEYYISTSDIDTVGGSWVTSLDNTTINENNTVWTRTKVRYTDGSEFIVSPQSKNASINTATIAGLAVQDLVNRANSGEFKGDKGDSGPTGPRGARGERGVDGKNGEDGAPGPLAYVKIIPSNISLHSCDLEAYLYISGQIKNNNVTYNWYKNNSTDIIGSSKKITNVDISRDVYSCHCSWT